VTKLVGNAAVLFARHPDQWNKVLADRSLIAPAVEEVLRYHPPSQYQGRFTVQESERHGVTIPAGYPIILITGAATRDDRHYDEPDRFEIERPASLSLGFGYGIHSCVGAALARMEVGSFFSELLPRLESVELAGNPQHVATTFVGGLKHLPIRYSLR